MANEYFDSTLTGQQIEDVLTAIKGVIAPTNNNKVLAIDNGKIIARSVQWGGGGGGSTIIVKPDIVTINGTYYSYTDDADGYSEFTVNVPEQTLPSATGVSF